MFIMLKKLTYIWHHCQYNQDLSINLLDNGNGKSFTIVCLYNGTAEIENCSDFMLEFKRCFSKRFICIKGEMSKICSQFSTITSI